MKLLWEPQLTLNSRVGIRNGKRGVPEIKEGNKREDTWLLRKLLKPHPRLPWDNSHVSYVYMIPSKSSGFTHLTMLEWREKSTLLSDS